MVGPEMSRCDARVRHLVVAVGVEADRKCTCRSSRDLSDKTRNGRAVSAAAEKTSNLSALQLFGDARTQQLPKLVLQTIERRFACFHELRPPVPRDRNTAVLEYCGVRRRQSQDAAEDRAWRRNHMEIKIIEKRLRIGDGGKIGNSIGPLSEENLRACHAVA
jgi:hypothetical protein